MNQSNWIRCGIAAMGLLWIPASAMATPITSGLMLWLDASDIKLNDGQNVDTWTDRSVNNNDATGTNQPVYSTNVLNGNPVVQFDGQDDQLAFSAVDAVSVFALTRARPRDGDSGILGGLIGQNGADKGIRRREPPNFEPLGWRGLSGVNTNGDDFTDPNGSEFRVDGVVTDLAAEGLFHTVTAIRAGGALSVDSIGLYHSGGRGYKGDYAELLVYDRALSRGEQVQVEDYLATKWAQPIPEPSTFVLTALGLLTLFFHLRRRTQ